MLKGLCHAKYKYNTIKYNLKLTVYMCYSSFTPFYLLPLLLIFIELLVFFLSDLDMLEDVKSESPQNE